LRLRHLSVRTAPERTDRFAVAVLDQAIARTLPLSVPDAVAAARRGEAMGWDALFDRYHRTLLRYTMARLGDVHGAEDVTQEVFVAAVGSLRRLRNTSEGGTESWLLGIARYKVADRIRRLRRERALPVIDEPVGDATEVVLRRLEVSEVRAALELLSDDQRDLILRRFVLDQSLEQVSEATGRRVGAVKSMQRRALASLARFCQVASA